MNEAEKHLVCCLAVTQSFSTYWAYYLQSGGQLFAQECRASARKMLDSIREATTVEGCRKSFEQIVLAQKIKPDVALEKLGEWANGEFNFPFQSERQSRFIIGTLIAAVEQVLIAQLDLDIAVRALSRNELVHSESLVRLKAHVPRSVWHADLEKLFEAAATTPTIVVMGDIRKSQDLMTYVTDTHDFSSRMIEFIGTVRSAIDRHHGVFDKFTGDGFLAYFNKSVSGLVGHDYVSCFLEFVTEIKAFAEQHFEEWCQTIRKRPTEMIGLAMGADVGLVDFQEIDYHLVAVGESIVWAARMASAAKANQVVLNNLMSKELEGRQDITLEPHCATTKAGEDFRETLLRA